MAAKNALYFQIGLALLALTLVWGRPDLAEAISIEEAFVRLPPVQTAGLSTAEKEQLIYEARLTTEQAAQGWIVPPEPGRPWVRIDSDHFLTLERPGYTPITYKLFDTAGAAQILAICRGRLRPAPVDPACPFDLCLFQFDGLNLRQVRNQDYMPSINVLDFVTADTLDDPRAVSDLSAIGQTFNHCLTCNLSNLDYWALDIVTLVTYDNRPCAGFLPPFERLPLSWDGLRFTKPYDRGVIPNGYDPRLHPEIWR